ncbi:hypothetical protein RYX36_017333 [Vicia faba]
MHDLVREAAQWIAYKEIRHVNLSNKDEKSSAQKEKNMKYLFCEGKDMDLFSWKYDGSKLETLILDVEMDEDRKYMEAPNSFFDNIDHLQVLYILGHDNRTLSLPYSISSLANIVSILVDGVDLGDISIFANLQSLETLDLVKCKINELPREIAKLGKLKLLNLERCEITRNDPFEVIGRCSTLEELYLIDSFNDFCREITLPELKMYHIQKGRRKLLNSLSKYVSFDAGRGECFFSKDTFKYCMHTTEGLDLNGIKEGWRNLMPEIVPIDSGMKDLVELRLSSISQLQCLIDSVGSQVPNIFPNLVVLKVSTMENLVELFNGSLSFDSLKNLEKLSIKKCKMFQRLFNCKLNLYNLKTVTLCDCPMLVNLSSLLTSRNLMLLEKLKIVDCEGLTNIIIEEGSKEHDNALQYLKLRNLPSLVAICPKQYCTPFPPLEQLDISECCQVAIKSIGEFIINHSESESLDNTIIKVSGSIENFVALESLWLHKSKAENILCLNEIEGEPLKLRLRWIYLYDLHYMMYLFVGPKNSFALQNLTRITIRQCEILEVVFSTSILRCISQLRDLIILNCKQLKHIIEDDRQNQNLSLRTCFPKLKTLSVIKCHKLKYVFLASTCKELLRLENLMIIESDELEEIFKCEGDQKVEIPNLNILVLDHLPSLFHTQGILFQAAKNRYVHSCQNLSLTSASTPFVIHDIDRHYIGWFLKYCTTFPPFKNLRLSDCSEVAIESIGEFIINHSESESLLNTITKSKAENILCLNEIEGQPLNLRLRWIYLYDLHYMMYLFVGPKNSFALQNLTRITIRQCEILEVVFSTSILRCISQLRDLIILNCKQLKHIIEDDRQNQNLSLRTCFPKLKTLSVIKCHKLKYVFLASTCKELLRLESLMIMESDELEEIFKCEGDQKVKIPNLNILVLDRLPSLFHTQGILFQAAKNRYVHSCQNLSLTSASTPFLIYDIDRLYIDLYTRVLLKILFKKLQKESTTEDTCNENSSGETTKDDVASVGIETEAVLGHETTYSQSVEEETALTDAKILTTSTHLELISSSQEQDFAVRDSLETVKLNDDQEDRTKGYDTGNENSSAETTKAFVVGVGIEVEATLEHGLTSSQVNINIFIQATHI